MLLFKPHWENVNTGFFCKAATAWLFSITDPGINKELTIKFLPVPSCRSLQFEIWKACFFFCLLTLPTDISLRSKTPLFLHCYPPEFYQPSAGFAEILSGYLLSVGSPGVPPSPAASLGSLENDAFPSQGSRRQNEKPPLKRIWIVTQHFAISPRRPDSEPWIWVREPKPFWKQQKKKKMAIIFFF